MKRFPQMFALAALFALGMQSALGAPAPIAVGKRAPTLTYRLLDGKTLTPAQLRGRKYVLWVIGTWCPSCQAGSQIIGRHIAELRRKNVALVEMEAYNNLGGSGPTLASVKDGIGKDADAPNWYWGVLSAEQTATIDPSSAMDVFYLVDGYGNVVAQGMAPGAHWDQIESFIDNP